MQKNPIVIASSISEICAPSLAACMQSVLDHHRSITPIRWYILHSDLSEEIQSKLRSCAQDDRIEIHFLSIDVTPVQDLTHYKGVHSAMYFHLLLPELIPHETKVLYLDVDTIVLEDIELLWNVNIDNYLAAAVQELGSMYVSSPLGLPNYKELGLDPGLPYCNAGILLMNLPLWRTESIGQKIIEYTRTHADIVRYWDQDGVNAILAGRWLQLDPTWNTEAEAQQLKPWTPEDPETVHYAIAHAKIIHFILEKPWEKTCTHPRKHLFFHYLRNTPWEHLIDTCNKVPAPDPDVPAGWSSVHFALWKELFSRYIDQPNIRFLEVGSWVGSTAHWFLQHILTGDKSTITCVDLFDYDACHEKNAYESGLIDITLPPNFDQEQCFDSYMRTYIESGRLQKCKGDSADILRTFPLHSFDCIYVDGSHIATDVLSDALLCWHILKPGGILLFDDYQLEMYTRRIDNPSAAIDVFLTMFQGHYDLLCTGRQVAIRKRANTPLPRFLPQTMSGHSDDTRNTGRWIFRIRRLLLRFFLSL